MLERLGNNFRILLTKFSGTSCPLCAVVKGRELDEIDRLRAKLQSGTGVCGLHLEMALERADSLAARACDTRNAIDAELGGALRCEVCEKLRHIDTRLVGSIRRLDDRMRFIKALESAPLFCRRHVTLVSKAAGSRNFAEVQRAKLAHLRDALAKAALLNTEAANPLIGAALVYFGRPVADEAPLEMEESSAYRDEEVSELERWDEQRQLERLDKLESEAAALRYRNAVLSEENRRFKLAHAALEALREDLERDRAELMAKKKPDSNGTKSSNRH